MEWNVDILSAEVRAGNTELVREQIVAGKLTGGLLLKVARQKRLNEELRIMLDNKKVIEKLFHKGAGTTVSLLVSIWFVEGFNKFPRMDVDAEAVTAGDLRKLTIEALTKAKSATQIDKLLSFLFTSIVYDNNISAQACTESYLALGLIPETPLKGSFRKYGETLNRDYQLLLGQKNLDQKFVSELLDCGFMSLQLLEKEVLDKEKRRRLIQRSTEIARDIWISFPPRLPHKKIRWTATGRYIKAVVRNFRITEDEMRYILENVKIQGRWQWYEQLPEAAVDYGIGKLSLLQGLAMLNDQETVSLVIWAKFYLRHFRQLVSQSTTVEENVRETIINHAEWKGVVRGRQLGFLTLGASNPKTVRVVLKNYLNSVEPIEIN